ncbi:glycosyltransferase family 9 protein [Haloferula sp. A504]|uniref:glycosyltransferase family 9 protein n=1 Tax=Haloferula sp. A504 TaxID=3373601 RepID=UPI0031C6CA4D|nr:hypothetical protein [Verrucomicrobiaceae bacterium E54]
MAEPLLVVAPSTWRDACFSLPATRALADVAEVTVLCGARQESFWSLAGFPEVIAHEENPGRLASIVPDLPRALLWEGGAAAKACAKAGIPHRTGLPAPDLAKHLTHPLERTVVPGPPEHQVRRFLDTAALLGARPNEPRWFEPLAKSRDAGTALIAPDSDFGAHFEWPLERWLELIGSIVPDPSQVRIARGPLGGRIAAETGIELVDLADPTGAGRFDWLIGADASLPHVAAAFGTTCIVLYGPGDPRSIRPLGTRHAAIRRKVECSPCLADRCLLDGRCQAELGIDRVKRRIRAHLRP